MALCAFVLAGCVLPPPPGPDAPPAGPPAAAALLSVSGSLSTPARIALPSEARMLVELRDERSGRVVAEHAEALRGRQVPLRFVLQAEAARLRPDHPHTLRATVSVAGRPPWTTEAVPVDLRRGSVDLGTLRMTAAAVAPAFGTALQCGERRLDVAYAGDTLLLHEDGRRRELAAVPAASGSRYAERGEPSTYVWFKGERAVVSIAGRRLPECRVDDGLPLPYRARGNEPAWVLDLADARLTFRAPGVRVEAARPAPEDGAEARRYVVDGPGLVVTLADRRCADTMSGMPHPHTVEVRHGGRVYRGCGGDPATLLRGEAWTVEAIDGDGLTERPRATLAFGADGRIAGTASCNSYTAAYLLTGESLSVRGAAATRRACAPALMAQERRFLAALEAVRRFELGPGGTLRLLGERGRSITARRERDPR